MAKYKKCPRCELNWIKEDEDLCDVCKAELKIGGMSLIEDDEDESWRDFVEEDGEVEPLDENDEIMLSQLEDEEAENEYDLEDEENFDDADTSYDYDDDDDFESDYVDDGEDAEDEDDEEDL